MLAWARFVARMAGTPHTALLVLVAIGLPTAFCDGARAMTTTPPQLQASACRVYVVSCSRLPRRLVLDVHDLGYPPTAAGCA